MKNKFKGFTLIELMCIIVILGVLITASIVAVSRVVNTAKEESFATQEQMLMKICENYIQHYSEDAPKAIGSVSRIPLSKLYDSKYLKNEVENPNGQNCMKNSYVRVYRLSNEELIYTPYLYCGNEKVDDIEDIYKPTINMYFTNADDSNNKIFDDLDNAYVYIDIIGGSTKGENPIAIDSYSFDIIVRDSYGEEVSKYTSKEIKANKKNNLVVKEKISDYVNLDNSTYISINIMVKNVAGGISEVTTTTQYNDK